MNFCVLVCLSVLLLHSSAQYTPDWDSLDTRPLPPWYDEAKIGIFIHWGVFSVPSFYTEWFWQRWQQKKVPEVVDFMKKNYPPGFQYADFAKDFNAEFYDPVSWAKLFKDAGAKYIVFTSKHHEGYCNWATNHSYNWNSKAVGPNKDLVAELATALRENTDIKLGLYHSLLEWFNPLYLRDKANNWTTQEFVFRKHLPELHELVETFKPEIVWSDGDWEAGDVYWQSKEFLAWLYNDSPVKDTVVVNDRWGYGDRCLHGDFWNCKDRYNPDVLQKHKWENAFTIDKASWGYIRTSTAADYLTPNELISTVAKVVANGGNCLINVGPTADGRIEPLMEERLRQLGAWLDVNGEAIYKTVPWSNQNDTITKGVWYTSVKNFQVTTAVYGIVTSFPEASRLILGVPKPSDTTEVNMLGYDKPLDWVLTGDGNMAINFPNMANVKSKYVWTLSFTNLSN